MYIIANQLKKKKRTRLIKQSTHSVIYHSSCNCTSYIDTLDFKKNRKSDNFLSFSVNRYVTSDGLIQIKVGRIQILTEIVYDYTEFPVYNLFHNYLHCTLSTSEKIMSEVNSVSSAFLDQMNICLHNLKFFCKVSLLVVICITYFRVQLYLT